MPVLPPPARPALAARSAPQSPASARASATNYVAYTHNLHGSSQIWHWDGRSGISLVFVVGFLCSLAALFGLLVLLSRLLARTNAPRTPAAWVPWRTERPPMTAQRSLLPPAPSCGTPAATPTDSKSEATFAETVLPLLGPERSPAPGPPPAVRDPRRNSRYGTPGVGVGVGAGAGAGARSHRTRSVRSKRSHPSTSEGMHRVQSIGRGNSHRTSARRGGSTSSSSVPDAVQAVA